MLNLLIVLYIIYFNYNNLIMIAIGYLNKLA